MSPLYPKPLESAFFFLDITVFNKSRRQPWMDNKEEKTEEIKGRGFAG